MTEHGEDVPWVWAGVCVWAEVWTCASADMASPVEGRCIPMRLGPNGCSPAVACGDHDLESYTNDLGEFFIHPECGPQPLEQEWIRCPAEDGRCSCQCDACDQSVACSM